MVTKLIEDIKKPTPRKNKRRGKIATVLAGVSETLALSGMFDDKPVLLGLFHTMATLFGAVALNDARQTYDKYEDESK